MNNPNDSTAQYSDQFTCDTNGYGARRTFSPRKHITIGLLPVIIALVVMGGLWVYFVH
jgi:hypothetical protein